MKIHSAIGAIDQVWAIKPDFGQSALATLEHLEAVGQYDFEAKRSEPSSSDKPFEFSKGVAVIPITGVMTKNPTSAQFLFGGTSTAETRRKVRAAAADEDVESIMLFIDSPGGSVMGLEDLANDVKAAVDGGTPVIAFIEDLGASAAYYVASQASAIFANKTAIIGSIGCLAIIEDSSRLYENVGVKVHAIATGDLKGQGADGLPFSKEFIADKQRIVDSFGAFFFSAVASGRKMSADQVKEVATGQVWFAQEAMDLGLIDGIGDYSQIRNDLQLGRSRSAKAVTAGEATKEETMADEITSEEVSLFNKIKSFFTGDGSPEQAEKPTAGAKPDQAAQALETANQALDAAATQLAQVEAKAFSASLLDERKITAGEREKIEESFLVMLAADGGGKAKIVDGKLHKGDAVASLTAVMEARPRHRLYEDLVTGADLEAKKSPEQEKSDKAFRDSLPKAKV
jgi:signal peptide peptidase SppA